MARIEKHDQMPIVPDNPANLHDRGKAVRRDNGPQTFDQRIASAQKSIAGSNVGAVNPIMDNDGDNDDD